MPKPIEDLADQTERWPWFIDVLFGVTAGLGLEKYADEFLFLWPQGYLPILASLIVAAGIASFVVYDIAIYHVLVKKFPFTFSRRGFMRLYLDLVMVFLLYLLLAVGFKANADWVYVLLIVSGWHVAASLWHILARWEIQAKDDWRYAILPHYGFILCYWVVAGGASMVIRMVAVPSFESRNTLMLLVACLTLAGVSWFRWGQVLKRFAEARSKR